MKKMDGYLFKIFIGNFWYCYHAAKYEKEIGPKYPSQYFCITQVSEVIHGLLS